MDTDERAQKGIKLASDKATSRSARHGCRQKATMAQRRRSSATTRIQTVEQVVGNIDQYKASESDRNRFRPGQTVLSKNAKDALDQMASTVKGQRGSIIEVQGSPPDTARPRFETRRRWPSQWCATWCCTRDPVYRIYLVGMGNAPIANAD